MTIRINQILDYPIGVTISPAFGLATISFVADDNERYEVTLDQESSVRVLETLDEGAPAAAAIRVARDSRTDWRHPSATDMGVLAVAGVLGFVFGFAVVAPMILP